MATFHQGRTSDMLAANISYDASRFNKEQKRILGDDLPFATAQAMTWLVMDAKEEMKREIATRYDRPKKYTLNSLFIESAKKNDFPNITAAVYFKDEAFKGTPAGKYLHPTIAGKPRPHKGFEKALIRNNLMLSNEYAVPGKNYKLNKYGNISAGAIRQMLSQVKAAGGQNETLISKERKRKNGRISGKRFFVAPQNSVLPRGIYQRTGRKDPVLMFLFVRRQPKYKVILPFKPLVQKYVDQRSERLFRLSFDRVIKTRRTRQIRSNSKAAGKFVNSLIP